MSRKRARQIALQLLFQMDFGNDDIYPALTSLLEEEQLASRDEAYLKQVVEGVQNYRQELDNAIAYFAKGWSFERLARVDRNILRLSIFEIRYMHDIPRKVSVNEAVELAKEFGDNDSPKFINGILGSVIQYLEEDEEDES